MIGASVVRKWVDPSMEDAIATFLSNGGSVERVPAGRHGECKMRKGVQIERTRQTNFNMEQSKRDLMADPSIRVKRDGNGGMEFVHE